MFAYCGNNPVNRTDATGQDWWHWAVAAAVVVVAAVAVVVTAGSVAGAIMAVSCVANGVVASTTASTIAAGVFIGSGTALAVSTYSAALESNSSTEFAEYGESAMYSTMAGGAYGAAVAYNMDYSQRNTTPKPSAEHTTSTTSPSKVSNPGGSHVQLDNRGNIYSYTEYDNLGRQYMRIDFQGKAHAGVLPHIHLYVYPERGGRVEYTFNFDWYLID